jgi:gas vesicle protein
MASDSGSVFLALLVGAAIGAGAGILYAPDEGGKTRKRLKEKAQKASDEVLSEVTRARDEITLSAQLQKDEFDKKLEDTISKMSYKADDIIAGLEAKLEELRAKNAQLQK